MSRLSRRAFLAVGAIPVLSLALFLSCRGRTEKPEFELPLPWPDLQTAEFLQTRINVSEFVWFTDVKSTASSFMNETMPEDEKVATGDVVILGEGVFHAKAEVQLPTKVLILTMERPFKERGKGSIWQVIKVEEKH